MNRRIASILSAIAAVSALSLLLGCQAAQPTPTVSAPKPQPAASAATAAAQPVASAPTAVPQPTAVPAVAPETLKIGIMAPLTGSSTRLGTNMDRFFRMGIDDVNAKGGIKVGGKTYRLEPVTADDKGTSEGGREAANRLVLAEKVRFIGGSIGAPTAGAQGITESSKVILLSYSAPEASLGQKFPLTVLNGPHTSLRALTYYGWVKRAHPSVKNVAIVWSDDSGTRGALPPAERAIKEHGLNLVTVEWYPMDIKDFAPLVTRLLQQKPEGLDAVVGGRGQQLLAMVKVLNERGWKGPLYGPSADVSLVVDNAALMEGMTTTVMADWKADAVTKREKEVFQRYTQKFGETEMEAPMIVNYNAIQVLAQAIEKAGTVEDTEKIMATVRGGEWETIWSEKWGKTRYVGAKSFGLPVMLEQSVYLSGVRQGKFVTLEAVKGTLP